VRILAATNINIPEALANKRLRVLWPVGESYGVHQWAKR
jgi:hypothetical protein